MKGLYFLASLLVIFSLVIRNVNLEFAMKLIALISLSFLYLETTTKVNYLYVFILLISILSDSFFVLEEHFYYNGLFLLVLNRFLYIVLIRRTILIYSIKKIVFYSLPFLLTFVMIYTLLFESMTDIKTSSFLLGIFSVILLLFTFLNLLNKNSNKSKYFFFGTTILPFADAISAIAYYIEANLVYVIIYHVMYYSARYLIFKSMVSERKLNH